MKKYMLTLMMMFIMIVLAACGTNNGNTDNNSLTDQNENPIVDENIGDHEDLGVEDNEVDEEPVENDNGGSDHADENLITETGIYNGQADPHTIEIETTEGPLAFQLTMEARDDIEALTEGGEVTYTYTEDGDTRTIESIQMNE